MWAGKLGLNVESHERRDTIVHRLREALYLNDGHADLNKYEVRINLRSVLHTRCNITFGLYPGIHGNSNRVGQRSIR
eukprot:SAG31_NODE_5919_length_2256_cov_2.107557_1_plen_77_part_00